MPASRRSPASRPTKRSAFVAETASDAGGPVDLLRERVAEVVEHLREHAVRVRRQERVREQGTRALVHRRRAHLHGRCETDRLSDRREHRSRPAPPRRALPQTVRRGRRACGSRHAAGRRRSSRRRARDPPRRATCSSSRAVAGETAFQSATSGRAPVRPAAAAIAAAVAPASPGGTIESTSSDSSTTASRFGRSSSPACSASAGRAGAAAGDGRDDAVPRGAVRGTDRAPHRTRADDPDGLHARRPHQSRL